MVAVFAVRLVRLHCSLPRDRTVMTSLTSLQHARR